MALPPLPARPWSYNPSSWNQRFRIAILAFIAALIALYLGLYQWRILPDAWDPIFGDQTKQVLDSDISQKITRWIRIPDAILGVLAYLSDAVFALGGSERRWQDRPWLVIVFGIDVIPLGFVSAILVLLQGFAVKAWCFLCLLSAVISLTLIVLAYDEVASSCFYLHELWKISRSPVTVWRAFWGRPCKEALDAGEAVVRRKKNSYVGKNR